MGSKKKRRFKDNIKKTFIIYALIPVFTITFLSYIISFSIWYRTVVDRNRQINDEVSGRLDAILTAYMDKAYELSEKKNIIQCILMRRESADVYEECYKFTNSMDARCNFFVFDDKFQPVIFSSTKIPEYASPQYAFSFGIGRRMAEKPEQVVIVRDEYDPGSRQILSIGKAVIYNDDIIGFITFDIDQSDLTMIISENFSINVVVTDQHGNVISTTNPLLTNKFGKLDSKFKNMSGKVPTEDDNFFVTKTNILNDNISVYTITSIGYFNRIYLIVGVLLLILFLMLAVTLYFSAHKIACSKTKSIDEIIQAIENVRSGDLDTRLNINTNDEFEIIAESYNQMLVDIKNLIDVNREKERQNVLSEIKQLESQFNPHFLFNTLEMIKFMIKIDPSAVSKTIQSLSAILRYSIDNGNSEVELSKDIEYTVNYLFIQKQRFGKQFDYSIDIDENAGNCIIPKLIIQPIIENSVKYGFEKKKSMNVRVKVRFVEENLVIVIFDDGSGMEPDTLKEIRNILRKGKNTTSHVGLFNVHRRIQLIYGEKYGIELMSEKDQGTMVKIILPVIRKEKPAAG